MALRKCPRCELNYIKEDEKLCSVCRRASKHEDEPEEIAICIECGEHPALKGKELCAECYKESLRQEHLQNQRKSLANLDFEDVDDVAGVTLPDEEIPTGGLPDELADDFDDELPQKRREEPEEGEIEFSKDLSLEMLSDEEGEAPDDDSEYDEGYTPVKSPRRQ